MHQPEPPAESVNNADAEVAPDSRPAGGDNPDYGKLPSEVPMTIDLVRMQDGQLAVMAMSNGRGRAGSTVRHNHRVYRVPNLVGTPLNNVSLPDHKMEPYGSTAELFQAIKAVFNDHAAWSEPTTQLLTYWVFASWFADCSTFAPALVLTGSVREGDSLLLLLSYVCRFPLLLAGIGPAAFASLPLEFTPTLLIREPDLGKRMLALLRASSSRSYHMVAAGGMRELYCPKALYLGEHAPISLLGSNTIRMELPNSASVSNRGLPSRERVLQLQNRLLNYRVRNSANVVNSSFDAAYSPDVRAIAQVLGACIVDDVKLQADLVPLLAKQEEKLGSRRKDLEATVLEALLLHCHGQQSKIFVRDITKTVHQIYRERGERLEIAVEEVGYKLKGLGLFTRRLGSSGRGLKLDEETQALVHERAHAYQLISPDFQDEDCQHCQRLQVTALEEVVKDV